MEQGLVESRHIETQKVMGMLVKDVMQCSPNETGELLHVVEFIIYNTTGPHGYTPNRQATVLGHTGRKRLAILCGQPVRAHE